MERLLVLGIDTVAGANLAESLSERCAVLGLYGNSSIVPSGIQGEVHGDDPATVDALARAWQPRWIVACGAFSAAAWDETAPPTSNELAMVKSLTATAQELSASLTVISSDVVFAGPRMFHDESSPPASPATRARHVLAVEHATKGAASLVVRTHVYGWSPASECTSFAERAYQAIVDGPSVAADGQRHATPILAADLAPLLVRAFELRLAGLYHLSGAERTSPHRFASELAAACGGRWDDRSRAAEPREAWLEETSLSSKRARRALKMPTPLLREGLARFVAQDAAPAHDHGHKAKRREAHELAA